MEEGDGGGRRMVSVEQVGGRATGSLGEIVGPMAQRSRYRLRDVGGFSSGRRETEPGTGAAC